MKNKLKITLQSFQKTFQTKNLVFDGKPENFWAMLSDPEVQTAIADVMDKKVKQQSEKKSSIQSLPEFSGSSNFRPLAKGH